MIKKHINRQPLRRIVSLILVFAITIALCSCTNTYGRYPSGNIDVDKTYLSLGTNKVTYGDLWNELRYSTVNLLENKVEESIVDSYLENVKGVMEGTIADEALKTNYTERLEELAILSIYSITDVENLDSISTKQKSILVNKYVDTIYVNYGDVIDPNDLLNGKYELVYKYFYLDLAKKLFSFDKLEEEIAEHDKDLDEDEDAYYSDSTIRNYYSSNYKNVGDVEAVMIRFTNEEEVTSTLKAFGIKTYKNALYYIDKPEMSWYEYSKFYDDLEINLNSSSQNDYVINVDVTGGEAAILQLYIEIYNYIYTYRDEKLTNTNPSWSALESQDRRTVTSQILDLYTNKDEGPTLTDINDLIKDSEYVNFKSKAFSDVSASFKTYVYETLTAALDDSDDSDDISYSTSGRAYGDYYYLVFKLNQVADEEKLCEDEEDEDLITNETLKAKIIEDLKLDDITDSYVTSCMDKAKEDVKVYIFDTVLEISYSVNHEEYSKTRKSAKDADHLAQIEYDGNTYYLTISEAFDELEKTNGSTTAIDILSKKVLKETDFYKSLGKDKEEEYSENLSTLLASFAQDAFTSYGYPASIGKYNFMILYFRSTEVNDIINNYYKIQETAAELLNNYENEGLLNIFQQYTLDAYNNYFDMTASRLLAYVDMDEDTSPDKDFDWNKKISNNSDITYAQKAQELIQLVLKFVKLSSETHATALESIVSEFNSTSRFNNGLCSPNESGEYNPTAPECTWAEYRKLGLSLKIDALANISNASTESDVEIEVQVRLKEIYNSISFRVDETIPTEYLDTVNNAANSFKSNSGFNLLLVTAATNPSSSEFENTDNSLYTNIPLMFNKTVKYIETIQNEGKTPTLNQIKLYLYEFLETSNTTLTPTEISSALDAYFRPVYTRYSSSGTQREVLIYVLKDLTKKEISFESNEAATRFENIMRINRTSEDNYLANDDLNNNFANWWENLENFFNGGNQ